MTRRAVFLLLALVVLVPGEAWHWHTRAVAWLVVGGCWVAARREAAYRRDERARTSA